MLKQKKILMRILSLFGAVVTTTVFAYLFDYILYPFVTYKLKVIDGFLLLFILALICNYVLVLLYDLFKKDLFGFDEIKHFKTEVEPGQKKTLMQKVVSWGDLPAFLFLSWYDPFLATLYKREPGVYTIKKKDYINLLIATAIGCGIWSSFWNVLFYFFKLII